MAWSHARRLGGGPPGLAVPARVRAGLGAPRNPSLAGSRARFSAGPCALYHYDRDVFGFRTPREFQMPDYPPDELENRALNANLLRFVLAYRNHGHRAADLDPLGLQRKEPVPELDPARYGLPSSGQSYNLSGILHVGTKKDISTPRDEATIETITSHLKRSYCGRIAFEFQHIPNAAERRWFSHMIESFEKKTFTPAEKKSMYHLLTKAEVFDHFMAKRFPQVKRYGLEGEESMMVALDTLFAASSAAGVIDLVLCMPHRGRLNLLTDLLKYNPTALFHKVKGNAEFPEELPGTGDVLSHLATSVDLNYGNKRPLHISMIHNPSHLEAANPVAMGKARAKQMYLYAENSEQDCYLGDRVMCVQLHGDAAFTGQGVVMETLGLSNLPHFTAGGSVHVIVNNQIGYTTPATNSRSTVYTSDVGKMINCPVIHVNADYPEDVAYASALAFEYRNKFRKDCILDLIGYRRMGHNELDEPAFTQPVMYKNIRSRKSVAKLYEDKLLAEKVLASSQEAIDFRAAYFQTLDKHLEDSYSYKPYADMLKGKWTKMILPTQTITKLDTGVDADTLRLVGNASVTVPQGFIVHNRLTKYHIEARLQRVGDGTKVDWATAEALAWGTLLLEGYHVRISGQDVGRGTFSQRHCMLVNQETEEVHIPLNQLTTNLSGVLKQGKLEIANSSLSEFAVVGFEFGVSWESPQRLVIWEAQFGDFFNGAQIVIDTFLASSEAKWFRQSGLVLLLPHGYDGAGPEHSSSRVERFLQLCDDKFDPFDESLPVNPNMHVVNCTTPSQYFHVLRRQMKRNFRKPLIIVAPKSLLKASYAVSDFAEMAPGTTFLPVLGDTRANPDSTEKIVFVSGKAYYDLVKARDDLIQAGTLGADTMALVRMEELCPFPTHEVLEELEKFKNAREFVWFQEEPQNQGPYTFVEPRLKKCLERVYGKGIELHYVGRTTAPVVATGIGKRHKLEVARIMKDVFEIPSKK